MNLMDSQERATTTQVWATIFVVPLKQPLKCPPSFFLCSPQSTDFVTTKEIFLRWEKESMLTCLPDSPRPAPLALNSMRTTLPITWIPVPLALSLPLSQAGSTVGPPRLCSLGTEGSSSHIWRLTTEPPRRPYCLSLLLQILIFFQVVWADSYKVGCAVQYCSTVYGINSLTNVAHFICNYGPGQSYQRPYRRGSTCSACPSDDKCLDNLCTNPKRDKVTGYHPIVYPDWLIPSRNRYLSLFLTVSPPILILSAIMIIWVKHKYPHLVLLN
ncbi:uncharacterized protein LOC114202894 [Eumetopias jubatus]|uniref:uncharacterized protein LOC114202894 n=1 Tax=Eumetopias jubatus TaxID=34886 RepID=UPI001016C5A5|nr:uncharacterized protein LOC114202894 [Eumetopias jubatus]